MSRKYKIQKNPFVVPTTDGKLIQEHWGNSTGNSEISIAHDCATTLERTASNARF